MSFKDNDGFIDLRMMRPIIVLDEKNNSSHLLQPTSEIKLGNDNVTFCSPNIVSLFVSIAKKELEDAKVIFNKSIHLKITKSKNVDFEKEENKLLFNYFEKIGISIVAIYTAVEALANIAIPNDYKLEKMNKKKVIEIWNKQNIERWICTTEKIGDIIPEIMHIESPKKLKIWSYFKSLEEMRNYIRVSAK